RTDFTNGREVVGIFKGGLVKIRLGRLVHPLYGRNNDDILAGVISDSPIELLDALDIQPGFAEVYVGYGGKDEFNLDAQVDSFLYRARQKGIEVTYEFDPEGKHDVKTATKLFPGMMQWLALRMQPYSPR